MLWLLLPSLFWASGATAPQDPTHNLAHRGAVSRPKIHYCRSTNMETFTCWWLPLDDGSQGNENMTYTFKYRLGRGPVRECPDYVTGGPRSCHFDMVHTVVWQEYCMNVTAHGRHGSRTSEQHCVDVADIVELDPPFNLTYTLLNGSLAEPGRTVLVAWQFPVAPQVETGWITPVYELRFRPITEPSNWKVKGLLREPHLEMLDLPIGNYEVMVRCRAHHTLKLWSKWSSSLIIHIPGRSIPNRMLALILVMSIGVTALLIIGFGVLPQGKRIKAFLLPPIPKPRIRGIEPMLLKNGKLDEINRHFASFHGYHPPQHCEESWTQVSLNEVETPQHYPPCYHSNQENKPMPIAAALNPAHSDTHQLLQASGSPAHHTAEPASYCEASTVALPSQSPTWGWPVTSPAQPEMAAFPGMDYSMILNPVSNAPSTTPTSQDFYTCVNGITPGGRVHLVPCLPDPLKTSPYLQLEEGSEKSSQLAAFLKKQTETLTNGGTSSSGEAGTEQSEFVVPLLSHSTDRT